MRRVRGHGFAALGVVLLLLAAGCGDDGGDSADDGGGNGSGGGSDLTLVEDGKLTVCTDAPYEPFEFEKDGEFTGFDMELLRAIATNLELELAVTVQPFDGIWLAPDAGTCDLAASAMTITEEREEAALFSDPYFDADQSLLVRAADKDKFAKLTGLGGATIAVQTGTTGEEYANKNKPDGAEIKSFDDASPMFLALESGDVDAILQDFPVNAYRATQDDKFVVTEKFATGEQYGFATSKENTELMDAVNEQLDALREDGTYDKIFEDWFGAKPASS